MKTNFQNKIIISTFCLLIFWAGLFLTSTRVQADGAAGLVPCGNGSVYADRCTLCHLVVGFDDLIDYGFNIFIFLALASLLAAGIFYIVSTGNQEMMGKAKGIMLNTLFGFAFVLLGWLLVNFTLYILGGKDSDKDGIPDLGFAQNGEGRWDKFKCISDTSKLKGSSNSSSSTVSSDAYTSNNKYNCSGICPDNSSSCPYASWDLTSTSKKFGLVEKCSNQKGSCECACKTNYKYDGGSCVSSTGASCGYNDLGTCKSSSIKVCPSGFGAYSIAKDSCGSGSVCCIDQNKSFESCGLGAGECFAVTLICPDGYRAIAGTCSHAAKSKCCEKK